MKNFLKIQALIICLMFLNVGAFAQSSQMATLLHDGEITNYYSGNAFIEALDAAADGDVISLSSGSFTAKDITKNVTIRGVGFTVPGYNENENPTVLTGDFYLKNPKSETNQLSLEGILHNGEIRISNPGGLTALKCQFNYIGSHDNSMEEHYELNFIHCVLNGVGINSFTAGVSLSFINSVIKDFLEGTNNVELRNSVVTVTRDVKNCNMANSVLIFNTPYYRTIDKSSYINNSIIIGCENDYASGNNVQHLDTGANVFSDGSFYELLDEYKQFKGTDGTEIGIHGGNMPFTPITSRPRITKFNVASKTTSDGKLSVDIEVKGEE